MGVKVFELIDRRELALKCLQDFIACGGNVQSEIDKSPDLENLREDPESVPGFVRRKIGLVVDPVSR